MVDWLVFNTNFSNISAISLRGQILLLNLVLKMALNTNQSLHRGSQFFLKQRIREQVHLKFYLPRTNFHLPISLLDL